MSIQGESKKNFESVHDRPSLHKVRGQYGDLNHLMDSLSERLNHVACAQEKEFLSAYRVHMLSVQLELKELKEKVAKAEMSLQDDGEVSKLEEECNWFRMETNRLQTHSSTMQTDIKSLKTRLSALRDQNEYLSGQLKAVMKRSRVLEVEIDMAQQAAEFASSQSLAESQHGELSVTSEQDQLDDKYDEDAEAEYDEEDRDGKAFSKSLSAVQLGRAGRHAHPALRRQLSSAGMQRPDALVPLRTKSPPRSSAASTGKGFSKVGRRDGGGPTGKSQARLGVSRSARHTASAAAIGGAPNDGVDDVSFDVEIERLRSQLADLEGGRTPVEVELEKCILQTFDNIVKRRSVGVARNSKNRHFQSIAKNIDATGMDDLNSELENAMFASDAPISRLGHTIAGGITEYGLEHFTDADRLETMIALLSTETVFTQVVNYLDAYA